MPTCSRVQEPTHPCTPVYTCVVSARAHSHVSVGGDSPPTCTPLHGCVCTHVCAAVRMWLAHACASTSPRAHPCVPLHTHVHGNAGACHGTVGLGVHEGHVCTRAVHGTPRAHGGRARGPCTHKVHVGHGSTRAVHAQDPCVHKVTYTHKSTLRCAPGL